MRLLSQPPDSLNALNTSPFASHNFSSSSAAGSQLGGAVGAHLQTDGGAQQGKAMHPGDVGGGKGGASEAGVVKLDLVALSAGFQKLAAMPKFSGIAFETTISDLHEQVHLLFSPSFVGALSYSYRCRV